MNNLLRTILSVALLTTVCCSEDQSAAKGNAKEGSKWLTHLNPEEASKLLQSDNRPVVLDIRTPFEFKSGNIAGAVSLDYYGKDFEGKLEKFDKAKPILVHCRSGGRSRESLAKFEKLGFKEVYHLDGGILAWDKAGLPIEKK
jgi:phage shock protein E